MQLSLDKYLSDVERHLETLPPNVRQGEIDEMASHLQQLRADFLAQGHTNEQAESLATARFGTARRAGLRLRDVWEGNRGVAVTFFAVLLSNYVLQLGNLAASVLFFFSVIMRQSNLVQPLAPLIQFWFWWTLLLLPFGLNFLLGRWAGRRAALAVVVANLPLMTVHADSTSFSITVVGFKLTPVAFMLVLMLASMLGAWSGSALKRRQRFAIVGGATLEEASTRLRERQKMQARRVLLRASTCTLIVALIGAASFAILKARVDKVLHPATPEAAVRVLLANPGMNPGEMHPSTNVSTRLLPATPEELAKNERRVSYTALMHASESFRQKRIAFLNKKLQGALGHHQSGIAQTYRDSLARLNPDGYTQSRVARVRKTSQGWQVDTSGDLYNQPHAWLYADYANDYPFELNR